MFVKSKCDYFALFIVVLLVWLVSSHVLPETPQPPAAITYETPKSSCELVASGKVWLFDRSE